MIKATIAACGIAAAAALGGMAYATAAHADWPGCSQEVPGSGSQYACNTTCDKMVPQGSPAAILSCNQAEAAPQPPSGPIPAACQQYVGPDAAGNNQSGLLALCRTGHQLTGQ